MHECLSVVLQLSKSCYVECNEVHLLTMPSKLGGHLLSRQDASDDTDACVIACSPDTCNSNNCALSTSKRDLMTGFEYASNGTYDDHALPKTLVRRKFDDPLDAKQYVSQQVQKISGAQSIRPASADGVSNPSFCIQQIFADLPLDQGQRVFGTAEDQRVRGCTVLTVVGARGFYMASLPTSTLLNLMLMSPQ